MWCVYGEVIMEELKYCKNLGEGDIRDQFVCSNCGIELQQWVKVERDLDYDDEEYSEYWFRYCPNCGKKIDYDE